MSTLVARWMLGTVLLAVLAAAMLAPPAVGDSTEQQACNLRGSWIADSAETSRYVRASFDPGGVMTDLTVKGGPLIATFAGRSFTLGALNLKLTGRSRTPGLKIVEIVDLEMIAPYRVAGRRISLSRGTKTVKIVRAYFVTPTGSKRFPAKNQRVPTIVSTVPYTCTATVLRLKLPVGRTGTTLMDVKFDRER